MQDLITVLGADYSPDRHTPSMLTRFLKARKNDPAKASQMVRAYEDWYIKEQVSQIHTFVFSEEAQVSQYYVRYYHKTDTQGRPIYIEQLKNLDVTKLFKITTPERLVNKYVREYEKLLQYRFAACSKKQGTTVEQSTSIIDLKGVPLSQFNQVRKVLASLSHIASDYYPETMARMFIINAPTLFTAIWQIIKQMLDENTVAKISVIGSGYKEELLKIIPKENLQVCYGGECTLPAGDVGPWNDGSVEGFPIEKWENMAKSDSCPM